MYIVIGSTLAILASILVYGRSRKYWGIMAKEFIVGLQYQLLGMSEVVSAITFARYNKAVLSRRTGSVAIVTGGARGIGVFIVKSLMQCDMEVIIGCRKIEAGNNLISEIRKSGVETGTAKVYHLDNSSLQSVRKFAKEITRDYSKINILINNAGIMAPPYGETVDGFEQQWGVNYLAHFLLTAMLMPVLRNAATPETAARVVNVTSCAHLLGDIQFDDINHRDPYIAYAAYAQTKLAQVLFTKYMAALCKEKNIPVHHYAAHPGVVDTEIFKHSVYEKIKWFKGLVFKTPEQGAQTIVYAAIDKRMEDQNGAYLSNCRQVNMNPIVKDKSVQQRLVALSLEQTELSDVLQYL